jgi:hypothetical protein
MTKDGAALPIDTAQLVSMMFALLPVPVAITDDRGRVVLCNSCFTDVFQGIPAFPRFRYVKSTLWAEERIAFQALPLTDQGYHIVFAEMSASRSKSAIVLPVWKRWPRWVGSCPELLMSWKRLWQTSPVTRFLPSVRLSHPKCDRFSVPCSHAQSAASHLVQSLTAIGGSGDSRKVLLDLNKIVRNVAELRLHQQEIEVDIVLDLDETLPKGIGDPSLVEQAVLTLLMNAEDAASNRSTSPH